MTYLKRLFWGLPLLMIVFSMGLFTGLLIARL